MNRSDVLCEAWKFFVEQAVIRVRKMSDAVLDVALRGRLLPGKYSMQVVIKQNLWASLGIVAVLIPATVFGLGIGPAVLIHEGSTLIVVANALRLLGLPMQSVTPAAPRVERAEETP